MSRSTSTVFALDINIPPESLSRAVEFCRLSIASAMFPASGDEIALVVTGAAGGVVGVGDGSSAARPPYISVLCPLGPPTPDSILALNRVVAKRDGVETGGKGEKSADFIEMLLVCGQLIAERKRCKQNRRVVYLLTDAGMEVSRKMNFVTVCESFRTYGVTLFVVGIGFSGTVKSRVNDVGDACDVGNDAEMPVGVIGDTSLREENEQVLRALCQVVDNGSAVISLESALANVERLSTRKVKPTAQRIVFTIGDVHIATQMSVKTKREVFTAPRPPAPLERGTGSRKINYSGPDTGQVQESERGEGISLAEAVKIRGPRGLEAISCVSLKEVPVWLLVGDGSRTITPLPNDLTGAKAFRSIVRAMAQNGLAMVVRYVYIQDANPVLGVCVPSSDEGRDVLFFSALPFAEDVRHLKFPDYDSMGVSVGESVMEEEEALVASVVDGMTVGPDVLNPHQTFNPFLQQLYATQRAKLHFWCSQNIEKGLMNEGENNVTLPLMQQLRVSSTAFGSPGNQLEPLFAKVRNQLQRCCRTFVYVPSNRNNRIGFDWQPHRRYTPMGSIVLNQGHDGSARAPFTAANSVEQCHTSSSVGTAAKVLNPSVSQQIVASDLGKQIPGGH
ncbi:Ku70 Ku80 N terminal alpha beta domain [Trypanosoma vivax]|uniref:Putative KU80 protein n=1 Tax=Trypanosoma vivax (strain Y486) TaxID=1055687 RepID=G0TWI9_TRYVY|nr:putative KU80 protein [Trypanosoma vivax]KAH8608868.1 Ku70 Ku80 N terminal alpha beta domain [Trypanosoma vivax]CCC48327.1 putative KU80 protein [Trypanosoma vivax Y486]